MTSVTATQPILHFNKVHKHFTVHGGTLNLKRNHIEAVSGISLTVPPNSSLAIVGESGCGKTTLARLALNLEKPDRGTIQFSPDGKQAISVATMNRAATKQFRQKVQMVFQDPYGSLNPRKTVLDSIAEPLSLAKPSSGAEKIELVEQALNDVGLTPSKQYMFRYPHEVSGGQRQRISIARALILRPSLIVADEPTSMLDAIVRTSIMRLMLDLQDRLGIAYIYITHNIAVARYMCEKIAVMYLGKLVELSETEQLLQHPAHPYTAALIAVALESGSRNSKHVPRIKGSVTKPLNPPPQCRFLTRCLRPISTCHTEPHPALSPITPSLEQKQHAVACYNPLYTLSIKAAPSDQ